MLDSDTWQIKYRRLNAIVCEYMCAAAMLLFLSAFFLGCEVFRIRDGISGQRRSECCWLIHDDKEGTTAVTFLPV